MTRLQKTCVFSIIAGGLLSVAHSTYWILGNYMSAPYWDAWEFFRAATAEPGSIHSLEYFLRPHNAHIIATSKAIFAANFYLFRGTSLPLIAAIVGLNIAIAGCVAHIGTKGYENSRFILAFAISSTFLMSLAQWENLLWAFQLHISLVLLFAIVTLTFLQKALQIHQTRPILNWGLYAVFLLLTVYSLGNGFTIIAGIVLMSALTRARLPRAGMAVAIYLAIALPFIWVARHGHDVGDPDLRTTSDLIGFWFRMMGGPWAGSEQQALFIGAALAFGYTCVTYKHALVPGARNRPVDQPTILLFSIAAFLFGTVLATSWGRVTLGPTAGLASRYATPMLILTLTLGFAAWRNASGKNPAATFGSVVPIILAGLGFWSHLKPTNYSHIRAHTAPVEQASYFIASNVWAPEYIRALYPDADAIRPAVSFLRDNQLSIFSKRLGLAGPPADFLQPTNLDNIQTCKHAALERVASFGGEGWAATGWAGHETTRQAPSFVLAFDGEGRLLGYTKPLIRRSDVVRALDTTSAFRGFVVPIGGKSSAVAAGSFGIWLLAVFDRSPSACRIPIATPLP
jgi:hypothetical protein